MKGYWLRRNDVLFATQRTPWRVQKLCSECQRRNEGKKKQYFIPAYQCTEDYQSKHIPVEEEFEQKDQILSQLESNVDFNQQADDSLNDQLKRVKIQKTKADTRLVNQRLDQRKKQLFYNWSERFFNCFADHFGRLKNCLVQMHLNQQQIKVFNQTLDKCLENMELDLNTIYNEFKQEKQNED